MTRDAADEHDRRYAAALEFKRLTAELFRLRNQWEDQKEEGGGGEEADAAHLAAEEAQYRRIFEVGIEAEATCEDVYATNPPPSVAVARLHENIDAHEISWIAGAYPDLDISVLERMWQLLRELDEAGSDAVTFDSGDYWAYEDIGSVVRKLRQHPNVTPKLRCLANLWLANRITLHSADLRTEDAGIPNSDTWTEEQWRNAVDITDSGWDGTLSELAAVIDVGA